MQERVKKACNDFNAQVEHQQEACTIMMKALEDKKLKNAESSLIEALYLYQQYNLPRCYMMVQKALDEYSKLSMKKERLKYVKEQILIRY